MVTPDLDDVLFSKGVIIIMVNFLPATQPVSMPLVKVSMLSTVWDLWPYSELGRQIEHIMCNILSQHVKLRKYQTA